jgi:hypothetical protein
MRTVAVLSLIAAFALPHGAAAEGARPREACRADLARLCKGIEPGGGRIRDCIKAHRSEISPQCRAALRGSRERRQAAKAQAK